MNYTEQKIAETLEKRKCDDSPLYLAVAVNLHKVNPSPESAYLIGKKYLACTPIIIGCFNGVHCTYKLVYINNIIDNKPFYR